MEKPLANCSDCSGELERVDLIDATYRGFLGTGSEYVPLSYAPIDAKTGFFSGGKKPKGQVHSFRCTECGRIFMYGFPR